MSKKIKIGIVCCSNGQELEYKPSLNKLYNVLQDLNITSICSDYIYCKDGVSSGKAIDRANSLMEFYKDIEIDDIFDISGGDIANEVLPYLNYEIIRNSTKRFWGYSDLTTVINAIYAKAGKSSVLYQIRNLIYSNSNEQIKNFKASYCNQEKDLFNVTYEMIQGHRMNGIVLGGNIRCLLKLAGTTYWPDMNEKVLFLESHGGYVPQMITYLNQLEQIGVFHQISGIILGTFTSMEAEQCSPTMIELVKEYVGSEMPIAVTKDIGHGSNSRAIVIGEKICIDNNKCT